MPILPSIHPSISRSFTRTFTSTPRIFAKSTKQRLAVEHADVPPYPYGPSQFYKQSNFGLRHWRPNVQRKRLYSPSLGRQIKLRVTTKVLRTIDKAGGLDEYLLGEKTQRIKELGMGGWKLRWRIMQTETIKERFRAQREKMGLPPKEEVYLDENGFGITKEEIMEQVRKYDAAMARNEEVVIDEEAQKATESEIVEENFMAEEQYQERKPIL
ncbi:hypothetical protein BPOR_0631g00040 [Botrytis porri]|uniref:Ribosomal protein L28 n=1 Tax=Botrytis porri TaxID=87229 RepID=A0A4Z1KQ18_9HELO|nr:hypothetical protein BPOR_0631g00040 [Botrytis porri]